MAFVSCFVELDGLVTIGQIKVSSPTTDSELRTRVDETLRREHQPPQHERVAGGRSRADAVTGGVYFKAPGECRGLTVVVKAIG